MSGAPSRSSNIEAVFPLSPTQEGMLYHTLKSPGSAVYVGQHVLELDDVDAKSLHEAWRSIVAQHPALRTVFAWKSLSRPVQVVYRAHEPAWHEIDFRERDDLNAWLAEDAKCGFALDAQPPSRVTLLELPQQRSLLVWTRHHVIMDGWSAQLVIGELHRAYTALRRGLPWSARPDLGMAAYVAWLQKQDGAPSIAHWRRALAGAPVDLGLGLEAVRSSAPGGRSARRIGMRLAGATSAALTSCAAANQLTLSTLIHGAWAAVLASLDGRRTVLFGSTVSGRPADLPEQDRIVGNLISTVPIVADTRPNVGLASWLRELQASIVGSARHGHLPHRDILAAAGIHPGTTLFDSIVVFMNYPRVAELDTELRVVRGTYDEHSHYPLAILALPGNDLELILIHDDELIAADRADQLLKLLEERLLAMLGAMTEPAARYFANVQLPRSPLVQVPLRVEPRSVNACFWRALREHPTRLALCHGDERSSYAQLHARATQLAACLHEAGVRPGDRVVVQLPRTVDAVAAIWAVLLLGAAYVPVSSESPIARLRTIVEQTGARVVVGNRTLDFAKVLQPHAIPAERPDFILDPQVPLGDAYVIFTSGSTGTPKAITVTHEQLAHSLASRLQYYGDDAVTFGLFSPLAFDSSVAGLFWTVACGGCLVLVDEALVMRPHDAVDYLIRHRVDTYLTLPGVHRALLDASKPALASLLRTVIVAGEACPAALLAEHRDRLGLVPLVNEYGPTEATVWCAARRFDADVLHPDNEPYLSIGRAIPGVELTILADAHRPAPPGVTGELVVGGRIVAAPNRGDGRYATGDLVSASATGEIFFRGRKDQQIKIRGHRVDPLEIEAALLAVPGVTEAAVAMLRLEGTPANAAGALAAFFAGEAHVTDELLRRELGARLPDYMIPQRFVRLDALPRNSNGKLARERLSLAASPSNVRAVGHGAAERTLYPRQAGVMIGNVWRDLLPGVAVDLDSNFFQIGGDSLLAMRMLARVERMFGTTIDLTVFMAKPVLGDFAEAVVHDLPAAEPSELITLRVGSGSDRSRSVFCVHGDAFNLVPVLDPTLTLHWISQWPTRIALTKLGRVLPLEDADAIAARYQRHVDKTGAVSPILVGACAALPVTLELGRRMTAAGNPPRALVLMDFPGRALQGPLIEQLHYRSTHSPLKSVSGWASRRVRLIREERAQREISAKARASRPLTDLEARAYTQHVLAKAIRHYEPRFYEGKVVLVFSQRWRRGVPDERSARLPGPWASAFRDASIRFSPAADHNDLLARDSARFVAELIAAEWR
jgi:amino acid adenylation domain-containing protein